MMGARRSVSSIKMQNEPSTLIDKSIRHNQGENKDVLQVPGTLYFAEVMNNGFNKTWDVKSIEHNLLPQGAVNVACQDSNEVRNDDIGPTGLNIESSSDGAKQSEKLPRTNNQDVHDLSVEEISFSKVPVDDWADMVNVKGRERSHFFLNLKQDQAQSPTKLAHDAQSKMGTIVDAEDDNQPEEDETPNSRTSELIEVKIAFIAPKKSPRNMDGGESTPNSSGSRDQDRLWGDELDMNDSVVEVSRDAVLGREPGIVSSIEYDELFSGSDPIEMRFDQSQTVAEETNGRVEEEEPLEKTDQEEANEEPSQPDDGSSVSPTGVPDETPVRDQSEHDGNQQLDDKVPPASKDTGQPTNSDDANGGATKGSGTVDQSAENNDLNERLETANEKQEQASENGDSLNHPAYDVKDEAHEESITSDGDVIGEIRPKRSVDDIEVEEDSSIDNKANDQVTNDDSPADDTPTTSDDVRADESGSPQLDVQSIQNILTEKDVTTNDASISAISMTGHIPATSNVPLGEIPTNDEVPTINDQLSTDDTPDKRDDLSSKDFDAIQDIIKFSVTNEGEPPSTNSIDIPSFHVDPGSADENQDDDGPDQEVVKPDNSVKVIPSAVPDQEVAQTDNSVRVIPSGHPDPEVAQPDHSVKVNPSGDPDQGVAQPDNSVKVIPSDTKIPNGDVNRAKVNNVEEDPPHHPGGDSVENSDNGDRQQEDDGRSNPLDDDVNKIDNDHIESNNNANADASGNNSDNKEEDDEIDTIGNVAETGNEEGGAKGDGDDNNNDVDKMDMEAPGTPDSNDVVSGDPSSDENDEDTSNQKDDGDPSGGSGTHTNGPAGEMDSHTNMGRNLASDTEGSSVVGAGGERNSRVGAVTPEDFASDGGAEHDSSLIAGVGSNVGSDPEEVPGLGAGGSFRVYAGLEESFGAAVRAEGSPEVAAGAEKVSGTVAEAEDDSGAGVITDAEETPRQVGNGRIPHAETESQNVAKSKLSKKLSFRGITHLVLINLSLRQHSDATQDTIEVPIACGGQEKTLQDGETPKGEGLSNATTAIIGAQSSPDTINTDDFQETDSRQYRSSRRPQTPLPAASTVLPEEDEDEGVIGDQDEEDATRRELVNGDEARHLQGRVIGERNMDNQAAASNIVKGGMNGGAAGTGAASGPPKPDPEVDRLIARGDLSALAELVLNGEGHRLVGRRSEIPELQSFIENVPTYMAKIQSVHDSARSGQLRELQAALDRRKFAVARDPRTPAGATPLHAAVLLGQTAVVRYLAGRFPETLAARDARGRAPLHCAAALPDNGHYFNLLLNLGADRTLKDNNGRTASYYMQNPGVLTHKQLLLDINAPESIADDSFSDKVPDDKVSSRRRVINDPELANTMDKYFQVIGEAAAAARADNRPVCRMVVLKFLTKHIFDQCKYLLTRMDHGILNLIWPAILDQSRSAEDKLKQSGTYFEEAGIVMPDYESYSVFSIIVLPVVKFLNGMDPKLPILPHPPSQFFEDTEEEVSSVGTTLSISSKMELRNDEATQRSMDLDPSRKVILHSVVHCTRNLEDFNLPLCLTLDELTQVERYLRRALLAGRSPYEAKEESGYERDDLVVSDDEGTYYTLEELSDPLHDIRAKLRSAGQWLEQQGDPDRSMRLHGKYWPFGRGVFITKDGSIAAYINVQDHLRVMVAAKEGQAGKIGLLYRNLGEFMNKVDSIFRFKKDDVLGHLAARPWVCGNTMRFKVTVRLPKLGREPEHLIALCKSRNLRLASAASLDVFHFSNRQCLGITEVQTYRSFVTAVANILQLEHRMEANGLHFTAILGKFFRKRHLAEASAVVR